MRYTGTTPVVYCKCEVLGLELHYIVVTKSSYYCIGDRATTSLSRLHQQPGACSTVLDLLTLQYMIIRKLTLLQTVRSSCTSTFCISLKLVPSYSKYSSIQPRSSS